MRIEVIDGFFVDQNTSEISLNNKSMFPGLEITMK